jgi:hypothetical protein
MIDDHPTELKALELFREGRNEEANRVQDEFLQAVLNSGEDHCSCRVPCKHHGKCVECVVLHRGHGHHLPNCFRDMVNRRLEPLSQLTEHTLKRK